MNNNWYVLTGGPSCGKTTLLHELEKLGHFIIPEAARIVIDKGIIAGKTPKEIRADERAFQDEVLMLKLATEKKHDQKLLTFFDRGMQDTVAYYKHYGWELPEFASRHMQTATYKKVFLLDQLPEYEKDYARTEAPGFAEKIQRLLNEAYQSVGLEPVRVPVLPVPERVKFILDNL